MNVKPPSVTRHLYLSMMRDALLLAKSLGFVGYIDRVASEDQLLYGVSERIFDWSDMFVLASIIDRPRSAAIAVFQAHPDCKSEGQRDIGTDT